MTRFWFGVRRNSPVVDAGDLAQAAEMLRVFAVDDATRRDAQGQVPAPVLAFDPAEAIAVVVEREGARGLQREPGAPLHFGLEPVEPAIVDGVFQACALALGAIAEIALRGDDGGGDIEQLLGRDEADHVGQARIGLRDRRGSRPCRRRW